MNFSLLLQQYWSPIEIEVNLIIGLNLLGSLILGCILGYERAYQGRAAGMRTYGIVCLASCAMTVFSGYSNFWFGHHGPANTDPTRVIQGIITGIGFLGSAVIVKDGFSISGLSTAASIWMCCAVGIMLGVGFYFASIILTLLTLISMIVVAKIEHILPQKKGIMIRIKFKEKYTPSEERIRLIAFEKGYLIPHEGIQILYTHGSIEWNFSAFSIPGTKPILITELSKEMTQLDNIDEFHINSLRH